jgi:hypothetical protein
MQASLSKLVNLTQHESESIASYGKKFVAQLEATEEVSGLLIPAKYRDKTQEEQAVARDKLLACMFLAGADRRRFKPIIDELNNDFLRGKVSYPEDVGSMCLLMSHYRGSRSDKKLDAFNDGVTLAQIIDSSSKKKKKKKKKKTRSRDSAPTVEEEDDEDDDDEEEVNDLLREASRVAWSDPN